MINPNAIEERTPKHEKGAKRLHKTVTMMIVSMNQTRKKQIVLAYRYDNAATISPQPTLIRMYSLFQQV